MKKIKDWNWNRIVQVTIAVVSFVGGLFTGKI